MEYGILYLGAVLLSVVVAILWIALPFAVFGTKPILQSILRELKATNKLLADQSGAQKKLLDLAESQSAVPGSMQTSLATQEKALLALVESLRRS